MTDVTDEYEDDLSVECASCNGGVLRSEAFKEGLDYYHPRCAGVWRCRECGEWNDNDKPCPCGQMDLWEVRHER